MYHRANNTVANISPNHVMTTDTNLMMSNVILQMQGGESPLDRGMLPRAYGEDENDNDSSGDNYKF